MKKLIIAVCILSSVTLAGGAYHPYRHDYYGDRYYGDRYNGGYYGRGRADDYYGGYGNDRSGSRRDEGYYGGGDGRYYRDYDR